MVLSQRLARFNRVVTNPIARLVAGKIPGFALIHHQGRTSGKPFTTPVNIFGNGDPFAVALTYGAGVQWLKNVQAADGCLVTHRGRTCHVTNPTLTTLKESRQHIPAPVRAILRLINVDGVLLLYRSSPESGS